MICFIYLVTAVTLVFSKEAVGKLRLIKENRDCPPLLLTDEQINELILNGKKFFDLTDQEVVKKIQSRSQISFPKKLIHKDLVKAAQNQVDGKAIKPFLTKFSAFKNRYYDNQHGVQAAEYLYEQIKDAGQKLDCDFSVEFFNHTWLQPSIIARLKGYKKADEIVIVGAHLDSINQKNPMEGIAPGADDDGSGISSILESIRGLAKIGFKPNRTVEFHFYSAEEVGLRGSQTTANKYAKDQKNVVGMLQLDMTGYNQNNRVQVVTDYTDPELTQFLRLIIDKYSIYKWFNATCGYACSDHGSFDVAGYPAVYTSEEIINPKLHTTEDTLDRLDLNSIAEFAKIALGFIIELTK